MTLFAPERPQSMPLRQYQTEAKDQTIVGFQEVDKGLVVIPTGGGKTILFAHLAKHFQPGRTLILAHREELLTQAVEKIQNATGLWAEIEKAERRASYDAPVVVASVQTLARRADRWPQDHFSLIVIDEAHHCFPAGTIVDGRPIESIKLGEYVRSFAHQTQRIAWGRVTSTMNHTAQAICQVFLENGKVITCTPDHPIWNGNKYVAASIFSCEDMVYEKELHQTEGVRSLRHDIPAEIVESDNGSILFVALQNSGAGGATEESGGNVSGVPKTLCYSGARIASGDQRADVLLEEVQQCLQGASECINDGEHESRSRVFQNEEKQSNAVGYDKTEDDSFNEGQAIRQSDGQRPINETTGSTSGCSDAPGLSVCSRVGCFNKAAQLRAERREVGEMLQAGHCSQSLESGNRGGREVSQSIQAQAGRCEKGCGLTGVRVVRVEIHQRGCGQRFDDLCPDGRVYNLEIDGQHNYFADDILVHNCLASSYLNVLAHFSDHAKILGVTATPDRGDKKNLGKYFEKVFYEVQLGRLIKDGFLSPIMVKMLPVKIDLSGVKMMAGDYSADDLGQKIEPWLERVAVEMGHECWDRKSIIFLPLVKTSERMRDILNKHGIEARSVSGYDDNRAETLEWFKNAGPGSALCNSMLLTEGFDQPDVDCIVNLRPTKVRALYAQMVGRGTRLSPGKKDCLLLDFLWQSEKLSLVSAANLFTTNTEDVKAVADRLFEAAEDVGGGETDVMAACEDVEEQRMRKVIESLKANRKRPPGTHDAIEMCLSIGASDLTRYEPLSEREMRPATDKQLKHLETLGFDPASVTCFGHASAIMDRLSVRRMEGLATPKQVRLMERMGHPGAGMVSFADAKMWLDTEFAGRGKR